MTQRHRHPVIKILIDILETGRKKQLPKYKICTHLGLQYITWSPVIDELTKKGLMEQNQNHQFKTSQRGSEYLFEWNKIHEKFGMDGIIGLASEKIEEQAINVKIIK